MAYHYFTSFAGAEFFLAQARAAGLLGYYVGIICVEHHVRTWPNRV